MGVTTAPTPQHCLKYLGVLSPWETLFFGATAVSPNQFVDFLSLALRWCPSSHQRLEHCAEIPCGWPLPAYCTPGSEPLLGLMVPGPSHSVDLLFPVATTFRSLVLQVHLFEIWTSQSCDSPRSFSLSLPTSPVIWSLSWPQHLFASFSLMQSFHFRSQVLCTDCAYHWHSMAWDSRE